MDARLTPGAEGRDAAAEPQIADGIVRDGHAGLRQRPDIRVVDPDRMDDDRVRRQHALVGGDLHQRAAIDLVAERALGLRLKDVDVERQLPRPLRSPSAWR